MTTDIFVFICKTDLSKPVKQEVNGTGILSPLVFPAWKEVSNSAKRASLLGLNVHDKHTETFYSLGPDYDAKAQNYKTFYGRNLPTFVVS